jgi:hypothetical protein
MIEGLHLATHQEVFANAQLAGEKGILKLVGLNVYLPCIMQLSEGDPKLALTQSYIKAIEGTEYKKVILSFHKSEMLRLTTFAKGDRVCNDSNFFYIPTKDCFVNLYIPKNCLI